jgi:hypothetical protein
MFQQCDTHLLISLHPLGEKVRTEVQVRVQLAAQCQHLLCGDGAPPMQLLALLLQHPDLRNSTTLR